MPSRAELALMWPRVGAVDLSAELGAKIYGAPATLCFLAPRAPVTICRDARTGESLTRNKLAITS